MRKRYNKTYAGTWTKRELNRRVNIAWAIIILVGLIVIAQNIFEPTNDMTIPAKPEVIGELEFKPLSVEIDTPESKELAVKPTTVKDLDPKFGLNETVIGLVDKWSEHYGHTNTHKAKAIISCEGKNDAGVCNYEYGCAGGQGHFQWIPSSWISICEGELGLTDRANSSQNIQCGIYTLQKYGDSHWGSMTSWWGSKRCWNPKL